MSRTTRNWFVVGTDTGVGKTVVSALLVSALRATGRPALYWKPIQTGPDSDTRTVEELLSPSTSVGLPPVYEYAPPIAPLRAADLAGDSISFVRIADRANVALASDLVIEGAGGIATPLARPGKTVGHLAKSLGARALLVAPARLGAIHQASVALDFARGMDLAVAALIWTGDEDPGLEDFFTGWRSDAPPQFRVPRCEGPVNADWIRSASRKFFASTVSNDPFQWRSHD